MKKPSSLVASATFTVAAAWLLYFLFLRNPFSALESTQACSLRTIDAEETTISPNDSGLLGLALARAERFSLPPPKVILKYLRFTLTNGGTRDVAVIWVGDSGQYIYGSKRVTSTAADAIVKRYIGNE